MNRFALGAAVALSLLVGAGCATSVPQAISTAVAAKTVTAKGHVALRAPGYRLKAQLTPYTAADIGYIKVYMTKDGGSETYMGELGSAESELVLANLKMDSSYDVRLEAYMETSGGDVRIDADNADCVTTVTTTNEDEINDLTFALQLADQTFRGSASGGVNVTAGDVVDAEDLEELTDASPATSVN